jgi:hypothetical protein
MDIGSAISVDSIASQAGISAFQNPALAGRRRRGFNENSTRCLFRVDLNKDRQMSSSTNSLNAGSACLENPSAEVAQDPRHAAADLAAVPSAVRVLRSESEVEELRDAWMQAEQHPNSDIDFFRTVLHSSPGILYPYVLVVDRGADGRAFLVGRIEEVRLDLRIGYVHTPQPLVRAMVFIYGGLLGDPSSEECRALADAMVNHLKAGEADVAFFNHLRADSPLYEALSHRRGFVSRDHCASLSTHWQLTLPRRSEEFWARLSCNARRMLRKHMRGLVQAYPGQVKIECLGKTSELEEIIRKVESIADKTYQRGLGVGFIDSPDALSRLRLKAEKGWLRVHILSLDGVPCAFWSWTLYKGVLHGDYTGYDPAYRGVSPGMFLLIRIIEELCGQGGEDAVAAIDFGLGDARYKTELADQHWMDASFCLYAPNLRGVALNAYRTMILFVDRIARKIVGVEMQRKIKKIWRDLSRQRN